MADFSLDQACDALAEVVGSINGLRAKGWVDDIINAPEAHVFERPYDPRMTFNGSKAVHQLGVRVFVSRTSMRAAQALLREFREPNGSRSVRERIEDGDAWPVEIDYAMVTSIGQPFVFEHTSGVYWCADWDVDVVF